MSYALCLSPPPRIKNTLIYNNKKKLKEQQQQKKIPPPVFHFYFVRVCECIPLFLHPPKTQNAVIGKPQYINIRSLHKTSNHYS